MSPQSCTHKLIVQLHTYMLLPWSTLKYLLSIFRVSSKGKTFKAENSEAGKELVMRVSSQCCGGWVDPR